MEFYVVPEDKVPSYLELLETYEELENGVNPYVMPEILQGMVIVAAVDLGLGREYRVCDTLDQIRHLNASYNRGYFLTLHWYVGPDPRED